MRLVLDWIFWLLGVGEKDELLVLRDLLLDVHLLLLSFWGLLWLGWLLLLH